MSEPTTREPYNLLAVTSSTGLAVPRPAAQPVRAFHVMRWTPSADGLTDDGWLGDPPLPGNAVEFDVGDTDGLTERGYRRACELGGAVALVQVRGSGRAVGSLQAVLRAYRRQQGIEP